MKNLQLFANYVRFSLEEHNYILWSFMFFAYLWDLIENLLSLEPEPLKNFSSQNYSISTSTPFRSDLLLSFYQTFERISDYGLENFFWAFIEGIISFTTANMFLKKQMNRFINHPIESNA